MSGLRETLSQTWLSIQISLFPWLSEELGPLTKMQQEPVSEHHFKKSWLSMG
jgi:hypothetical protein